MFKCVALKAEFTCRYCLKYLFISVAVEGGFPTEEHVRDHANRPNVALLVVLAL